MSGRESRRRRRVGGVRVVGVGGRGVARGWAMEEEEEQEEKEENEEETEQHMKKMRSSMGGCHANWQGDADEEEEKRAGERGAEGESGR